MEVKVINIVGIPEFLQVGADSLEHSLKKALFNANPNILYSSLIGNNIKRCSVMSELEGGAKWLCEGEDRRLIIYYNGHGDQTRDTSGDEDDGKDEFWRLAGGGRVLDDEITSIFGKYGIPEGCALLVISDSCSSGTMVDKKLFDSYSNIHGHWASIGACLDRESAFATSDGGVFTLFGFIPAIREGTRTPKQIFHSIQRKISIPTQHHYLQLSSDKAGDINFI